MEAEGAKLGYKFLYSTIQQIEAGVVPNPHFATVRAIMHILGRSLAELDVPPDPDLEQISQLVADIKRLDPYKLEVVKEVVSALHDKAKREHRTK